jgi:hypothetical protein
VPIQLSEQIDTHRLYPHASRNRYRLLVRARRRRGSPLRVIVSVRATIRRLAVRGREGPTNWADFGNPSLRVCRLLPIMVAAIELF